MDDCQEIHRCRECLTIFEIDVADRNRAGLPRCPQCFLSSSDPLREAPPGELVIRQSTPFR